jgi:hypothetical protein
MAEKTLQSLRTETKPREDNVRGWDYVTLQSAFDGPPRASFAEYLKSVHVDRLTPALIEAIMAEHRSVGLAICGGAIADVAPTETAIAGSFFNSQFVLFGKIQRMLRKSGPRWSRFGRDCSRLERDFMRT